MNSFMTLLRPTSEDPPADWVQVDPEWFDRTAGKGVRIELDPEAADAGRAIGFVSPPGGERCYMNVPGRCLPTPTGSPDGFRTFHADSRMFATADGGQVEIPIGSVPLGGGHSNPMLATTPDVSAEFLQRKQRWARLVDDIALYGAVEDTPDGLLFRGWVAPNVTIAEAEALNNTVMSGEWIPDPEMGGRQVFSGITRVGRTALPMRDLPMAASLDDCGCDPATTVLYTFAPADLAALPTTPGEDNMQDPPNTEPVRASTPEFEEEVRSFIADMSARMETLEKDVAALGALAVEDEASGSAGPGQTIGDVVALVQRLGNEVSALREAQAASNADTRRKVDDAERDATTSDGSAVSAPAVTGNR